MITVFIFNFWIFSGGGEVSERSAYSRAAYSAFGL